MDSIFSIIVICAFLGCGVVFLSFRTWRWEDRAGLAILLIVVPVLIGIIFVKTSIWSFSFFSAARLAPTIALSHGYQLFYGVDAGPVMNTIYGPLAYLVYFPAAVAFTPAGALLIAGFMKTAFYFIPLFLLVLSSVKADRTRAGWIFVVLACCLIVAVTYLLGATNYMVTQIHSDAPSLGLGMLSCLILMRARVPQNQSIIWAGLLAASAVWVKQTEFPLVIAQCIYLWMASGWNTAVRYGAITFMIALVMGLLFVMAFGFEPMWLNMFYVPSQHAMDPRVLLAFGNLLASYAIFLPFIVVATLTARRSSGKTFSRWVTSENWFLPCLVAVFLIPTSLLGYLKVGGWVNSFHGIYYLLGGAAGVLARRQWPESAGRWSSIQPWVLVFAVAVLVLRIYPMVLQYPVAAHVLRGNNPSEEAYRYAVLHPGQVYFPWLPLSSLMAEGKLYHFDFGLRDRQNAGIMTSFAHYRAYLPSQMRYVAMPGSGDIFSDRFTLPDADFFFLNYAERFSPTSSVELEGLDNFHVLAITNRSFETR